MANLPIQLVPNGCYWIENVPGKRWVGRCINKAGLMQVAFYPGNAPPGSKIGSTVHVQIVEVVAEVLPVDWPQIRADYPGIVP